MAGTAQAEERVKVPERPPTPGPPPVRSPSHPPLSRSRGAALSSAGGGGLELRYVEARSRPRGLAPGPIRGAPTEQAVSPPFPPRGPQASVLGEWGLTHRYTSGGASTGFPRHLSGGVTGLRGQVFKWHSLIIPSRAHFS